MGKIVLIGAGGHCKVIIDLIKSIDKYEIVGIINKDLEIKEVLGVPVIGDDSKLKEIYDYGISNAFICIGALDNTIIRSVIYRQLKEIGFKLPVLIHKNSIVSKFSSIGDGTCILPGAIVNAGVRIDENCIINTASIVEHECNIKSNVHISPNACLGGGVSVGDNSHIGIGSTIIQGIKVGKNVTVGAGSVVINNIQDNNVVVGVPGKVLRVKYEI